MGLGPGNESFLGIESIGQCHFGPKTLRFQGPKPLPLAQVIDMHASKTLCTGLYKSYVHRFYVQEPTRKVSGPMLWGVVGGGAVA